MDVAEHEIGVLYYNHILQKELEPGRYIFWKSPISVTVKTMDMRKQQLDMTGQEIMTEDKVPLRLNFVCQYKIVDPLKTLNIRSFEEQMYIMLQLILREYVGTLKLDELLRMKRGLPTLVYPACMRNRQIMEWSFCPPGLRILFCLVTLKTF